MNETESPKLDFTLYVNIEKVEKGNYVFNSKLLRPDNEGGLTDAPQNEEEKLWQGFQEVYSLEDLKLANEYQFPQKCEELNRYELQRAYELLDYWREKGHDYRYSVDIQNNIKYLENVVGKYILWYKEYNLNPPTSPESKEKWTGTKTEFARFVNEEYQKNQKKYNSLRDAARKLFDKYEFEDQNWTPEKCYDLVRNS